MNEYSPVIAVNMAMVEGLTHRMGGFCLGPLSFALPVGAITALIGPNGAGKTTLIDLMYGLGRAQAGRQVQAGRQAKPGRITIAGHSHPQGEVLIKQRVGFVTPDLSYASWGRVGAALDYVSGFYPYWRADEADRLLALFAIDRRAKVGALSFGERTKLALITALARDTDALLLDEPTTGLDVAARHHLFAELLNYIQKPGLSQAGRAVLISSHQMSDLERLADRVIVLHRGQLLAEGATSDLVERYQQWDIVLAGAAPELPEGMRSLAQTAGRMRVMVDLSSPSLPEIEAMGVVARAPMNLEEVYLGLTSGDVSGGAA